MNEDVSLLTETITSMIAQECGMERTMDVSQKSTSNVFLRSQVSSPRLLTDELGRKLVLRSEDSTRDQIE